MGWFDEQIKQRKQADDACFEESFLQMASAVMGAKLSAALSDEGQIAKDAIEEVLKYFHIKARDIPDGMKDSNEQLEYLMRPYGIMRRTVRLSKGWYHDAIGPMLATRRDDGSVTALIPTGLSGYSFYDKKSGKRVRLNKRTAALIEDEALCFYKPFPLRKLGIGDLARYIFQSLSVADYVLTGLASLGVSLVGLLTPRLNSVIFAQIIPHGNVQSVIAMAVFLIAVTICTLLITSVKTLLMARISTKLDISVESATMLRVLSLPASFFKRYGAGDLSSRTAYVNQLCELLVSTVLSTGLSSLFSLIYITQINAFAPALTLPALVIVLSTVAVSIAASMLQMRVSRKQMELAAKESGMSYALISGVQKIKLSGAEKRAFARWGNLYAKSAKLTYDPPVFLKLSGVITTAISLLGWVVLNDVAVRSGMGVSDYYAFTVAYGMVSAALSPLATIALTVAQVRPIAEMAKPILEAVPEVAEGKEVLSRIAGGIELNNVSFRYDESMPLVLDDVSLKIRPGQYVAIVGKTGCGKSTLMRLLLGFETPQKGAIYYDGRDLTGIDLRSLRRKIGVVMQDGKLFQGDIFSNITISAPWLTLDDAWQAAELAGIAEDIRQMPMEMHTIISEGSGGISGGQRQRLMIARAVAGKPRILMLDEATSALDNITQRKVSESLDGLKCTRIVIAHRLSTIRQCDRIIVLDKGKIAEDGTYDELIAKNGAFAELVARQRVDV